MRIIFILILLFFSGCMLFEKKPGILIGSWSLNDITAEQGHVLEDAISNADSRASLNIFRDGTFTILGAKGEYVPGKWEIDEQNKVISLVSAKLGTQKFSFNPLILERDKELIIKSETIRAVLRFSKVALPLKTENEDPFHQANNKWRVKPVSAESEELVRKRLVNYFEHTSMILGAAIKRKQEIIDFSYSQGPIRIYNGGIGIIDFEEVPGYWKQYFNNDRDAELAYSIFLTTLKKNSYKGKSAGNWVEDDYNILLSIIDRMKTIELEG